MARWMTAVLPMACASRRRLVANGHTESGASKSPYLLDYYIPGCDSKEHGGRWGRHWTTTHLDPDHFDPARGVHLSSQHEPLVGPYDSDNPLLIDYHLHRTKIAGIDGVGIAWYDASR